METGLQWASRQKRIKDTKPALQERIKTLTSEMREFKDEARILWLNYGYLEDMLNDAAFALKLGRPLDDLLIAELLKFKWKDDGCHVKDGMEPGDMVFGYDVPAEATRHRSATQPSKLGATEALEAPK